MCNCQQGILYAAEETVLLRGRTFETGDELQTYVDDLRDSPWWIAQYEQVLKVDACIRKSSAAGSVGGFKKEFGTGRIELAPDHCNELFVLHELAHVLAAARYGSKSHDPWFARTYLELVYGVMGSDAYLRLFEAFERAGVDHRI